LMPAPPLIARTKQVAAMRKVDLSERIPGFLL
jgi:hypothetical protein